jgi:hypothetical protein
MIKEDEFEITQGNFQKYLTKIKYSNREFEVASNDRLNSDKYHVNKVCAVCHTTKFQPKVIRIRLYDRDMNGGVSPYLCSECLTRMIEVIQTVTFNECKEPKKEGN